MTSDNDFINILAANPRDWTTWLVYADWLQEHDRPQMAGAREIAKRKWRPYFFRGDEYYDNSGVYSNNDIGPCWLVGMKEMAAHVVYRGAVTRREYTSCLLPQKWLDQVTGPHMEKDNNSFWRRFDTCKDAILAVLCAHQLYARL